VKEYNRQSGFTLIEMAIVVLIIGALTASVVIGRTVVRNVRLKSVVSDVEYFGAITRTFKDTYSELPGDLEAAAVYWPDATDLTNFPAANGNGDNRVDSEAGNREDLGAWQHLVLAGMMQGTYTGTPDGAGINIGMNVPEAKISNGGYLIKYDGPIYGRTGNFIEFATEKGGLLEGPILSPGEAKSIDDKADDGTASKGDLFATDGAGATGCISGGIYNLSNENISCRIFVGVGY